MQSFPLKLPAKAWKPGSKYAEAILPHVIDVEDTTKPTPAALQKFVATHERHASAAEQREIEEQMAIPATPTGKTLNCNLLLQLRSLEDDPYDVVEMSLSAYDLTDVATEDAWAYFRKLEVLDLAENSLYLSDLEKLNLPMLTSLSLACNSLPRLSLEGTGFFTLQVLDLSFNFVDWTTLSELRKIPQLRLLNLSGNRLPDLPKDFRMCVSLEMLVLDDNKLSRSSGLKVLSQLPQLRTLHLRDNQLSSMPDFQSIARDTTSTSAPTSSGRRPRIAFPSLEQLDLAKNKFSDVATLAAISTGFPALRALDVSGNPFLTRQRRKLGLDRLVGALDAKAPVPCAVIAEDLDDRKGTGGGGGLAVKRMAAKKAERAQRATVPRNALVYVPEPEFFPSFRHPSQQRSKVSAPNSRAMTQKQAREQARREKLAMYDAMAAAADSGHGADTSTVTSVRRVRRKRRIPKPPPARADADSFFVTGGGLEVSDGEESEYYSAEEEVVEVDAAIKANGAVDVAQLSVWEIEDRLRAVVDDARPAAATDVTQLTSQLRKALEEPRVHPTVVTSKKQPGFKAAHRTAGGVGYLQTSTNRRDALMTPGSYADSSDAPTPVPVVKSEQVNEIEGMLAAMRERLANVEANLGAALNDTEVADEFPQSSDLLQDAESHFRRALEEAVGHEHTS